MNSTTSPTPAVTSTDEHNGLPQLGPDRLDEIVAVTEYREVAQQGVATL